MLLCYPVSMDGPVKPAPVKSVPDKAAQDKERRQSLAARSQNGRHELLQLFADIEFSLAELLGQATAIIVGGGSCKTFGLKLREAIKRHPVLKRHEDLIALRNLVAHAKIDVVRIDEALHVILRVTETGTITNARIIADGKWDMTQQAWATSASEALTAIRELNSSS